MNVTLYEMSETAKHLLELLESGEIDEQTVHDTMESIGTSEKLQSYVAIQKELEAKLTAFKAEKDRISKRIESLTHEIDRMKKAQIDFMVASGQRKAESGTFTLSLRDSKSVDIFDAKAVSEKYYKFAPPTFDKARMLKDLKDGKEVSGAQIKITTSICVR